MPEDLTTFSAAGTITQAILGDPTTILRDHIAGQTIASTAAISICTAAWQASGTCGSSVDDRCHPHSSSAAPAAVSVCWLAQRLRGLRRESRDAWQVRGLVGAVLDGDRRPARV